MDELLAVGVLLAGVAGGLSGFAPQLAESLVRTRARRLPAALGSRMSEEWLAELEALPSRASRLAFAVALALTRRHSFGIDQDLAIAAPSRPSVSVGPFNGWPTIITLTTMVVAACGYGASFLIPPLYQSQARIQVIPPRLPAQYVEEPDRIPLDDRLQTLNKIILGNTRIARLIQELNLYSPPRPAWSMPVPEHVIARMQQDITVELRVDGSQTFDVAYVSRDPRTAQWVTERLAGLYIEETLRDRIDSANATVEFLNAQIQDVRARLLKRAPVTHLSPDVDPSHAAVQMLERDVLKSAYRNLLLKKEQQTASDAIGRRGAGERFVVLDAASWPESPIRPNRLLMSGIGAAVGFCLGVGLMLTGRSGPLRRPENVLVQS